MNKEILSPCGYWQAISELTCVCGHLGKHHDNNGCDIEARFFGGDKPNESCECKGFMQDNYKNRPFGSNKKNRTEAEKQEQAVAIRNKSYVR